MTGFVMLCEPALNTNINKGWMMGCQKYNEPCGLNRYCEGCPSKEPTLNPLLCDLRAAVCLASNALERNDRPASTEIAKELKRSFGALSEQVEVLFLQGDKG